MVDASVAVKWLVPEIDSDKAVALRGAGGATLAPMLVLTEMANALWKHRRTGMINADIGLMLAAGRRYFTELLAVEPLLEEALQFAVESDHPIYDCIYCVAARRRGLQVVTADDRLLRKLSSTGHADLAVSLRDLTLPVGGA